jgi:hypothetical protein
MTILRAALLTIIAMASACAGPSGEPAAAITSESDRIWASEILLDVETAVGIAFAANKIPVADYELAMQQVATLRADVQNSATVPVTWQTLYRRVLNFGMVWGVRKG